MTRAATTFSHLSNLLQCLSPFSSSFLLSLPVVASTPLSTPTKPSNFTKNIHQIGMLLTMIFLRKFLRKSFKTPKRVDTPPEFHDIDDSDDEHKPNNSAPSRPNNNQNNVRLFSTPQHNPNNPFNATPQGTPSRRPPVKHR